MAQRKCCLCFPLKTGLLIYALFSFAGNIANIAYLFFVKSRWSQMYVYSPAVLWGAMGLSAIGAFGGLIGLIALTRRSYPLVTSWMMFTLFSVLVNAARMIGFPIYLLLNKEALLGDCQRRSPALAANCEEALTYTTVAAPIFGLIQFLFVYYCYRQIQLYRFHLAHSSNLFAQRHLEKGMGGGGSDPLFRDDKTLLEVEKDTSYSPNYAISSSAKPSQSPTRSAAPDWSTMPRPSFVEDRRHEDRFEDVTMPRVSQDGQLATHSSELRGQTGVDLHDLGYRPRN
ncbi:hypothetical protein DFS34DRAFT_154944 [Phlyctochytrium arcticum]|nr:hypothetical protein DFS34DRAFT_154944 [Phlyctochytrium arcticum]